MDIMGELALMEWSFREGILAKEPLVLYQIQ